MPEGPEVRRNADMLQGALVGKPLVELLARTRDARAWLDARGDELKGRTIESIRSHGKHLLGYVEGGYYFHVHLMMWGRWYLVTPDDPMAIVRDRRERARITVPDATALLYMAPVFDVGQGNPYDQLDLLATLGPDILPYDGAPFDADGMLTRMKTPEQRTRPVGAVLLDQQVLAGIGNYLRAEILFLCRIDPWKPVEALSPDEVTCLMETIPAVARHAYHSEGFTVPDEVQQRLVSEPGLVYRPGSGRGVRHYVFRRTNLPCLHCGDTIRQQRQVTRTDPEEDKTRIIYFCPTCQSTPADLLPRKASRSSSRVKNPPHGETI